MFKKFVAILAVVAVSIVALVGCGGTNVGKVDIDGVQNYEYAVMGNGGAAVQYGNYIYFLNGYRGYEDSNATDNTFGKVVKGGVYRVELAGTKSNVKLGANGGWLFDRADGEFNVKYTEKTDRTPDSYNQAATAKEADVELIAPKTVGTSGYSEGGITIYGEYMYYASPNNEKNRTGEVQYAKTDFFRMKLDGSSTQKLYTTENDSDSSPYGFYHRGNYVYLVVLDGTDLISIKIDEKKGNKEDRTVIAENVTSAVIPTKPVYYAGISENTIYDFVYYKTSATRENYGSGEVLTLARPDGSNAEDFMADGSSSYTLERVADGYLYYRKTYGSTSTEKVLFATNLHSALSQADEDYAAAYENDRYKANIDKQVLDISGLDSLNVFTFVPAYEFGANDNSGSFYTLTTTVVDSSSSSSSSDVTVQLKLYVYNDVAGRSELKATLDSGTAITIDCVDGNTVYYTVDGTLKKLNIASGEAYSAVKVADNVVSGTYGAEVAGGYLIYFASLNDDAQNYSFFLETNGLEGVAEAFFVGVLSEDDYLSTTESLEVVSQPSKTTYKVGDSLDITGLVVEATPYEREDGVRASVFDIDLDDAEISGFDSSSSGDVTVTVTYDKKTVEFTVTVED